MRILIADDHEIVRRGLKELLEEFYPLSVIEEANDGLILLNKVDNDSWDIVITDLSMPKLSGLEALRRIREMKPDLPVIVLSIYPEDQYGLRVIKAGAQAYLTKELAQEELIKAIEKVLAGKKYISPTLSEKLDQKSPDETEKAPHELLSNREFDVFRLIVAGKPLSEIAAMLSLGPSTISTYRARILEKMNIRSNAELTRYAFEHNLI